MSSLFIESDVEFKDLLDFSEYAEKVICKKQTWIGDVEEGVWYYPDHGNLAIYYGSFGNYQSIGTDVKCRVYDHVDDFLHDCMLWEKLPEYLEKR